MSSSNLKLYMLQLKLCEKNDNSIIEFTIIYYSQYLYLDIA